MTKLTAKSVLSALRKYDFMAPDEPALQRAIEIALIDSRIPFKREVWLTQTDHIDFLCGTIGIEVKVAGTRNEVLRQLMRYIKDDRITELILFTTRSKHVGLPNTLAGKPLYVTFRSGFG